MSDAAYRISVLMLLTIMAKYVVHEAGWHPHSLVLDQFLVIVAILIGGISIAFWRYK